MKHAIAVDFFERVDECRTNTRKGAYSCTNQGANWTTYGATRCRSSSSALGEVYTHACGVKKITGETGSR
jgi:hypothetical protein